MWISKKKLANMITEAQTKEKVQLLSDMRGLIEDCELRHGLIKQERRSGGCFTVMVTAEHINVKQELDLLYKYLCVEKQTTPSVPEETKLVKVKK